MGLLGRGRVSASEERNKRLLAEAWDMEQPGASGVAELAADIRSVVEENERLRECLVNVDASSGVPDYVRRNIQAALDDPQA